MVSWIECGVVEGFQGRPQCGPLRTDEFEWRPIGPAKQCQLEKELDAQIAYVLHRSVQPGAQSPPSDVGDPMDDSLRAIAPLGKGWLRTTSLDETVEGAVDQRTSHRHHPTQFRAGLELSGDGEAMGRLLGENAEHS